MKSVQPIVCCTARLDAELNKLYFDAFRQVHSGSTDYESYSPGARIMAWVTIQDQGLNRLFMELSWSIEENADMMLDALVSSMGDDE